MGTCFSCEYYKSGYCSNRTSLFYKEKRELSDCCVKYELYFLQNENEPPERDDFF